MTNALDYVSALSSKASFLENVLVLQLQGVLAFYWLNTYIRTRAYLATLATNSNGAKKLQWAPNNVRNLL